MDVKAGICKESWALKNWRFWTVVLEKTLESPLDCKEIQPIRSEGDQPWDFFGRNDAKAETSTLATSWEELTHWKRLWCWARLKAGGKGDYRGWDGWMASLTQWTWVWVNSSSWWWTGRPGLLQPMGSQRLGQDRATELTETFSGQVHLSFSFIKWDLIPLWFCFSRLNTATLLLIFHYACSLSIYAWMCNLRKDCISYHL